MKFEGDVEVTLTPQGAVVDGREIAFDVTTDGDAFVLTLADGRQIRAHAAAGQVHVLGRTWAVEPAARRRRSGGGDEGSLIAPMPGVVLQVRVAEGDEVSKGDVLMVVEAMKMEQPVKAPRDGVVSTVCFAEGDRVSPGDALVELSA